jgi:hypothetical protein
MWVWFKGWLSGFITFWKGAVCGPDGNASMTKCMAWAVFALITVSWFRFPDRGITDLCMMLASLLTHSGANKWGFHKHVAGKLAADEGDDK